MKKQRRTYRLWEEVEEQLEQRAKVMNLTPAKALNVILAQALGTPQHDDVSDAEEETTDDELPAIANHDAF